MTAFIRTDAYALPEALFGSLDLPLKLSVRGCFQKPFSCRIKHIQIPVLILACGNHFRQGIR